MNSKAVKTCVERNGWYNSMEEELINLTQSTCCLKEAFRQMEEEEEEESEEQEQKPSSLDEGWNELEQEKDDRY